VRVKERHPLLEAVIVGEGYRREDLEAQLRETGAERWLRLAGHISDEELVDLYRRAWAVASAAAREGWGMTITEAAACGTPAVATRIAGHSDAIVDEQTGVLVERRDEFVDALDRVLRDAEFRERLGRAALEHASRFTWTATARGTLEVLAADAVRRRGRP
jgi:glycosyltransferase involved in cell wall biosynthesis